MSHLAALLKFGRADEAGLSRQFTWHS